MPSGPPTGKCPTCGKPVPADTKHPPFCSDRCRLLDLGRWLKGEYVVSRPLRPGDTLAGEAREEE